MTVKELKAALAELPDDMLVGINETTNEATGLLDAVMVVNGAEDENRPYDKGDDIYALAGFYGKRPETDARGRKNPYHGVTSETKICFLNS